MRAARYTVLCVCISIQSNGQGVRDFTLMLVGVFFFFFFTLMLGRISPSLDYKPVLCITPVERQQENRSKCVRERKKERERT